MEKMKNVLGSFGYVLLSFLFNGITAFVVIVFGIMVVLAFLFLPSIKEIQAKHEQQIQQVQLSNCTVVDVLSTSEQTYKVKCKS